jgi:hypothetical protein
VLSILVLRLVNSSPRLQVVSPFLTNGLHVWGSLHDENPEAIKWCDCLPACPSKCLHARAQGGKMPGLCGSSLIYIYIHGRLASVCMAELLVKSLLHTFKDVTGTYFVDFLYASKRRRENGIAPVAITLHASKN